MQDFYFGSVFMAAVAYIVMALLLLLQRKKGERSRTILGVLVLVSVLNYGLRIASLLQHQTPEPVVSVPMLLLAIFMVSCYILYPIEVISPNSLNVNNIAKVYSPLLALTVIWFITKLLGVNYQPYRDIAAMLPHLERFDVWFRVLLAFMVFLPLIFIFFARYDKKYSNTSNRWIRGYVIAFSINSLGYIAVLAYNSIYIGTAYYYISVGCELYIVYQELFVRLIHKDNDAERVRINSPEHEEAKELDIKVEARNSELFRRLNDYLHSDCRWRDPDLSMGTLVAQLNTNRTTLALAIQEQGFDNYASYINKLRINEFISIAGDGKAGNFQELFFDVGFRSKSTALRNFRLATGVTPSEYFSK